MSKIQAAKLVELSKKLQKLERPGNTARTALKKRQAKDVEAVSMEMATSLAMIGNQVDAITVLSQGLKEIEKDMATSKKIFDLYFEPDVITTTP